MNAPADTAYENTKRAPKRGLTRKRFDRILIEADYREEAVRTQAFGNLVYLLTPQDSDIFMFSGLKANDVQKRSFEKLFGIALNDQHPLHQKAVDVLLTLPEDLIKEKMSYGQYACHDVYFKTLRKLALRQTEGPCLIDQHSIDQRLKNLTKNFDEATFSLFRIAAFTSDAKRSEGLIGYFAEKAKKSDDWTTRGFLLATIANYAESLKVKGPAKPLFENALKNLLDHFTKNSWVNHWLVERNSYARESMLTLFSRYGLVDPYRIAAESLTVSQEGKITIKPQPSRPGNRSADDGGDSEVFAMGLAGVAISAANFDPGG